VSAQVVHSDHPQCAGAAVRRLFGCSMREGLAGVGLVVVAGALAWGWHRYTWLGLFCAILLPIASGSLALLLALLLARSLLGRRFAWWAAWSVLLAALPLGAVSGLAAYQHWMNVSGMLGMADAKVFAASFGVAVLAMGVPLWHAQGQARAQHLAGLRQAALVAEMKALQAQVEPHFLYNTLANTRYLTRRDPDKAAQMLEHLIGYLHGALPDMRASTSTLGREFELADHYLALMAIRFGERLRYRVDCPGALADAPVPPLMLMTLVENAVKHGLEPQPGEVSITLAAARAGDALQVTVQDDGAGLDRAAGAGAGTGVGLSNLRQRLFAMYGHKASFSLARARGGLTEARLVLPLERNPVQT
jgi:LytS/YehU family sensor histidine kinase